MKTKEEQRFDAALSFAAVMLTTQRLTGTSFCMAEATHYADLLLAELDRTATANQSLTVPPDLDAMISACIPGGTTCDPQEVADSIRQWFADRIPDSGKKVPDAHGWIPHTPGDPMPCDGNLDVYVQLRWEVRDAALSCPHRAWEWYWGQQVNADNEVIAWKPAE